jgi:GTP cyclohydrolase FolE2
MTNAEIAAQLTEALEAAATEAAGAPTALVSVEVTVLAHTQRGTAKASVTRRTKSLVFMNAEFLSDGARAATATSVHKLVG